MSDTPRTDAAILSWAEFTDEGYGPSKYVHVDDMRALERDLIKAKQAISESRNSDLIRSRTDAIMEANALTEEVARLRGYAGGLEAIVKEGIETGRNEWMRKRLKALATPNVGPSGETLAQCITRILGDGKCAYPRCHCAPGECRPSGDGA
jgi:hypothetical protein